MFSFPYGSRVRYPSATSVEQDREARDADLPDDVREEREVVHSDIGGVRMLPEKIIDFFTDGDREHEFNVKLNALDRAIQLHNSTFYGGNSKDDITKHLTTLIEIAYNKGRKDERYYSLGPAVNLYGKKPD